MSNKQTAKDLLDKPAPKFELPDQAGKIHKLSQYMGKWVVLYFYPKDLTPGCTTEACSFQANLLKLKKYNAVIIGVSADTVKRHEKFAAAKDLSFTLLSDTEKKVIEAYKSWGPKKFMGRSFQGILRNTFLINPKGKVVKVYEGVKPAVHVEEILADLQILSK